MRLPLLRRAFLSILAFALAFPATRLHAENLQKLQQDLQRTLTRETDKFINSLRDQRNTPSSSSGPNYLPSQNQLNVAAARERREREAEFRYEQQQSDARWNAAHPNETREQYTAREQKEKAARRAAAYAASADGQAELAREAQAQAAAMRRYNELKAWATYRAENRNFTARTWPPFFPTPAAALAWYRAHDRESPNPWAAGQAAILLIDGIGVPANPAEAARLLDPRTRREPAGESPRPELAALFAYLRARHPEACVPLGVSADPAAARRDLAALALRPNSEIANWYLARLLADSADPADQKKALELLPNSYPWMRTFSAGFIEVSGAGSYRVTDALYATAAHILARAAAALSEILQTWPLEKIPVLARLAPSLPEPERTPALMLFADCLAERFFSAAPAVPFPWGNVNQLIDDAGSSGSPAAEALALFERNQLISFNDSPYSRLNTDRHHDLSIALPALARWAQRTDLLGTRARLALAVLVHQVKAANPAEAATLPEPFAAVTSAAKAYDAAYDRALGSLTHAAAVTARAAVLAAMATRDAAAPAPAAVPELLATLEPTRTRHATFRALNGIATFNQAADPALFAVESASFDLRQAITYFEDAFNSDAGSDARLLTLYAAMQHGDAFAPRALAQAPAWNDFLTDDTRARLLALSDARRTRDETARRPRAVAARVIETRFKNQPLDDALTRADLSASPLASRIQFNRRLETSMSSAIDAPPSWELAPALIAELDATSLALAAEPAESFDETFLSLLATAETTSAHFNDWFASIGRWEKDRQDRLTDPALVRALQPSFDALIATLGQWPGFNHGDVLGDDVNPKYDEARKLIATDGPAAVKLCLEAAVEGNRDALQLLAYHLRRGTGPLPRSAALADILLGTALKIMQADAEVGDNYAAYYLGHALIGHEKIEGDAIPKDPVAGLAWLHYAAARGFRDAAVSLHERARDTLPQDPVAARHWDIAADLMGADVWLPIPPRRISGEITELTPILPALEAALTAAHRRLADPKAKLISTAEEEADFAPVDAAHALYRDDRTAGLVAFAQLAAAGRKSAAFTTAALLAAGRHGLRSDQALALRFHAVALALQQAGAEAGDDHDAYLLGLHHLEFATPREPATALRWLTYAAELGNAAAAAVLASLYTSGAPGLTPDPVAAARWTAFEQTINNTETFKPRAPLR